MTLAWLSRPIDKKIQRCYSLIILIGVYFGHLDFRRITPGKEGRRQVYTPAWERNKKIIIKAGATTGHRIMIVGRTERQRGEKCEDESTWLDWWKRCWVIDLGILVLRCGGDWSCYCRNEQLWHWLIHLFLLAFCQFYSKISSSE